MISREDRERGERLLALCATVENKPVEWSVDDCSTWPLQWVLNETRQEIDWPEYTSRDEAQALISEAGGLVPLWDGITRKLGLVEATDEVLPVGSVAVVNTRRFGQIGCIVAFGNIGCFRMETGWRGWGLRSKTIVRAWTLP